MEKVTYQQFDSAIKSYVNRKIENYEQTYTESTVANKMNDWIEEVRSDEKVLIMSDGWREHIETIQPIY